MHEKIIYFLCGLAAAIVGFGLYSYYARELLSALTLFSMAFFFLALVALGMVLIWFASVQAATLAALATRNVLLFSRRMIEAYARV